MKIHFPSVADLTKTLDGLPPETDMQGWNSEHPIFKQLIDEIQPRRIVEVGTWKGASAIHMASLCEAEIFCVDTWLGGIDHALSDKPVDQLPRDEHGAPRLYHQFLRNVASTPFAARIRPIQQTSLNAAKILHSAPMTELIDLIYVDGSHEYDDVYADLCAYHALLAPGGRIFGDDFRTFPGVFTAVIRYAHERGRQVREVAGNYWMLL